MTTSALYQVQQDDPTLTNLLLCQPPTTLRRQVESPHLGIAYINDDAPGLKRICDGIGRNTHLEKISFDAPLGLSETVAQSSQFDGLRNNSSVHSLLLSRCDLSQCVGREVLKAFEENPRHLTKIELVRCRVPGGADNLFSTLRKCTSLVEISLLSCRVEDAIVAELVHVLRQGNHLRLTSLVLRDNLVGAGGCRSLAALLRNPEGCAPNLVRLDLQGNVIDDQGAQELAGALQGNDRLETLCIDDNHVSIEGWNILTQVLCDPSSIEATYLSNHTLSSIVSFDRIKISSNILHDDYRVIPPSLFQSVIYNGTSHAKNIVARQKILDCHLSGDFNMKPFVEGSIPTSLLPHTYAWIGRTCDSMSHTAMFQLLRQMPMLYINDNKHQPPRRKSRLDAILKAIRLMKKVKPLGRISS